MQFAKRTSWCAAGAMLGLIMGAASLDAQTSQQPEAELCRVGVVHPFVGSWNEELTIPDVGTASALITLNLDQTLTETVSVDLVNLATPGHGVWKALDCQHYDVALTKLTFDPKAGFGTEVFRGSALLAADNNSWTATLQRQRYNAQGVLISTDTITDTAKRFTLLEAPSF